MEEIESRDKKEEKYSGEMTEMYNFRINQIRNVGSSEHFQMEKEFRVTQTKILEFVIKF